MRLGAVDLQITYEGIFLRWKRRFFVTYIFLVQGNFAGRNLQIFRNASQMSNLITFHFCFRIPTDCVNGAELAIVVGLLQSVAGDRMSTCLVIERFHSWLNQLFGANCV